MHIRYNHAIEIPIHGKCYLHMKGGMFLVSSAAFYCASRTCKIADRKDIRAGYIAPANTYAPLWFNKAALRDYGTDVEPTLSTVSISDSTHCQYLPEDRNRRQIMLLRGSITKTRK